MSKVTLTREVGIQLSTWRIIGSLLLFFLLAGGITTTKATDINHRLCMDLMFYDSKYKGEIKRLLHQGADPHTQVLGDMGGYCIIYAFKDNCIDNDVLKALIKAGLNPNLKDILSGETLLMLAAKNGCKENIKTLIKAGADKNERDDKGRSVIDYAKMSHDPTIVNLVSKLEPKLDKKTQLNRNLIKAVKKGEFQKVKIYIKKGADINIKDDTGIPLITIATQYPKILQYLLAKGGNPNISTTSGTTPLMIAAEYGRFESAKILLSYGADINAIDSMGLSVLDHALINPFTNEKVINLLIKHGAKRGKTLKKQ